jgi:pyruvate/2-oxoacid:ferredoxin oxidoreductase alpha subunit
MNNGVERGNGRGTEAPRAWAKDALGGIALVESRISERIFTACTLPDERLPNAFGVEVLSEHGDVGALGLRFEAVLSEGHRAVLVASASALSSSLGLLASIAQKRLPAVVHAISERPLRDALALSTIGWGLLFAAGVEDALDMALVARRASEDCGTPFIVVHEASATPGLRPSTRHVEPVTAPTIELCEVFVGTPHTRLRKMSDPAHPIHAAVSERAFAERVPFALASAMRELESLTGRRHDVVERIPAMDSQVVLVGMGELGDSLIAAVERLRAQGLDVGAVKLNAFRPFPGARLVKMLSRALAVTVVEAADEPLAQSNPLTRELKAAFADALTWAPDYPGIGRIPRVISGVTHELSADDVDTIVHNMLADERGKRFFIFGADPEHALELRRGPVSVAPPAARLFTMRGRVRDARTAEACAELCASVLHSALGLRARASIRALADAVPRNLAGEGDGYAFDVVASRERPRGAHAPDEVRVVALEDPSALVRGNPLARLANGGLVALPSAQTSAEGVWSELPPYAKAIVFDRKARVVGFAPPAPVPNVEIGSWLVAASFAGIALAAVAQGAPSRDGGGAPRMAIDPSLVAREVAEALRVALGPAHEEAARQGGDTARRVFEASVEVPRTTIEKDEDAVRLGRRDSRAAPAK